jgi:hypothetical protein
MAAAFVSTTTVLNLNSANNSVTVGPLSIPSGSFAVVHVAISSAVVSVQSITDSNSATYTQKAFQYAQFQEGARSFTNLADLPGGVQDYGWPADITTTADNITEGQVRGEAWTAAGNSSTLDTITVTLTGGANFVVTVAIYTSSTGIGAAGSGAVTNSSAPSVALVGNANTSLVSAGFSSKSGLNQTSVNTGASTTTVKNENAGTDGSKNPLSLTVTNTSSTSTTFTPEITPTNTQSTDISISSGTQNAVLIPVPATYAVCAVEIKA